MDPDLATPRLQTFKVRFPPGKELVRCRIPHGSRPSAVTQINCVRHSFSPQKFGQSAIVKHGMDNLQIGVVYPFSDTIMLWSVMNGKAPSRPSLLQMVREFRQEIFPSSVRVETFDFGAVLG